MDAVYQIIILIATSAVAWLFGKLKTKREKTQADLQTVESTISPLLVSIKELNEHNKSLMSELLEERKQSVATNETVSMMKTERTEFITKIGCLEKQVEKLTKAINKLTKNDKNSGNTD